MKIIDLEEVIGVENVNIKDNTNAILKIFQNNMESALATVGLAAVEVTTDLMNNGYYRPIYQTGDLIRSIKSDVNETKYEVRIGSNLNYAESVHEGTSKMKSRPYLKDGVLGKKEIYQEVFKEYLGISIHVLP